MEGFDRIQFVSIFANRRTSYFCYVAQFIDLAFQIIHLYKELVNYADNKGDLPLHTWRESLMPSKVVPTFGDETKLSITVSSLSLS